MTPAELALWQALRGKQLDGLKFRSQHPVGQFILDFWCPACRLAVELDGGAHEGQEQQDQACTEKLEEYGYRVIRFRNEEVLNDLPSVLERIRQAAHRTHAVILSVAKNLAPLLPRDASLAARCFACGQMLRCAQHDDHWVICACLY